METENLGKKVTLNRVGKIFGALIFLGLLNVSPTRAEEWFIQPSLKLNSFYDDNYRLSRQEKSPVFGVTMTGESKLGVLSENSSFIFDARADINRYDAESDIDNEIYYFNLNGYHNINEKHQIGLTGSYIMSNSIINEFDNSGLVQSLINLTSKMIEPSWTYQFTEKDSLRASYSYSETNYDEAQNSNLVSYFAHSASLNFSHQWNARTLLFTTLGVYQFEVPDFDRVTTSYSIQSGIRYNHSETWNSEFMIGGRWTEVESPAFIPVGPFLFPNGTDTTGAAGYVFLVSTTKKFETDSITASVLQDVRPSGNGDFLEFFKLSLAGEHRFNERLKFSLTASYSDQTSTSTRATNDFSDRTYYTVEPRLSWNFTQQASLMGGYRFRSQEFTSVDNGKSESNSVYLVFSYNWDKFTAPGL